MSQSIEICGPNLSTDGETFHAHAAGCQDLRKRMYQTGERHHHAWVIDADSHADIVSEIYSDFLPTNDDNEPTVWTDFAGDVRIFPCVKLPNEAPGDAADMARLELAAELVVVDDEHASAELLDAVLTTAAEGQTAERADVDWTRRDVQVLVVPDSSAASALARRIRRQARQTETLSVHITRSLSSLHVTVSERPIDEGATQEMLDAVITAAAEGRTAELRTELATLDEAIEVHETLVDALRNEEDSLRRLLAMASARRVNAQADLRDITGDRQKVLTTLNIHQLSN